MTTSGRTDRNGDGEAPGELYNQTHRRLRGLIVEGRLAPGSPIVETRLADRLEVSRTPLRSALQRLTHEGFLERIGGDGRRSRSAVAPLTERDARELSRLLGMIEGAAARRGARLPAEERRSLLDDLQSPAQRLRESFEAGDPDDWIGLDTDFHRALVEGTGGPRMRQQHRSYQLQLERYVRFYTAGGGDAVSRVLREHENILRTIEAGEPDAAEEAVRQCWQSTADRLGRAVAEAGERGNW